MKLSSLVLLLCLFLSARAIAQSATTLPAMRSCAPIGECVDDLGKLTAGEAALIHRLLSVVTPGATESEISERFGRPPFKVYPPAPAWMIPSGSKSHKALWSTAEPPANGLGPHFDVLFINDRAVGFTWYLDPFKKYARVALMDLEGGEGCSPEEIRAWRKNFSKVLVPQLRYPAVARKNKVQGALEIEVSASESSSRVTARIARSSGNSDLDTEALRAARTTNAEAPVCGGRKTGITVTFPVIFRIEGK